MNQEKAAGSKRPDIVLLYTNDLHSGTG